MWFIPPDDDEKKKPNVLETLFLLNVIGYIILFVLFLCGVF